MFICFRFVVVVVVVEQCEFRGESCALYVCVTDLDFLGETLSKLGNVIVEKCPNLKKSLFNHLQHILSNSKQKNKMQKGNIQQLIHKKCCAFANQNGHLSSGRGMFM